MKLRISTYFSHLKRYRENRDDEGSDVKTESEEEEEDALFENID